MQIFWITVTLTSLGMLPPLIILFCRSLYELQQLADQQDVKPAPQLDLGGYTRRELRAMTKELLANDRKRAHRHPRRAAIR